MKKGQRRDDVMASAAFTCKLSLAVYSSVSVWLMYGGTAIPVIQHCSLTLTSPYVSLLFLPNLIRSTFVLSQCLWSRKWTLYQWPCGENKRILEQENYILAWSNQLDVSLNLLPSTYYVPSTVTADNFLPYMAKLSLSFSLTADNKQTYSKCLPVSVTMAHAFTCSFICKSQSSYYLYPLER